jgi:hypothetical protein
MIVIGGTVVIIVIMPAIIVNLLPMMTTLNGKSPKFPSRFFRRTDDRLGNYFSYSKISILDVCRHIFAT